MKSMYLRNSLFYLGLIPATILFTLLGTSSFIFPYPIRYFIITRWSYFFVFWAKITCGLSYRVTGIENIPKNNVIVFSNHQSAWETIFMQVLFPRQTWVLKKELLSIPLFGWTLALMKPIAINRKDRNSVKELIKQGKDHLQNGQWVIIFPEGTRVAPGHDHRFTRSGSALAESTGYSVLPMAHNAGLFWPRGYFIKNPGLIEICIGPVIKPEGKSATEINNEAEQWIKNAVSKLLHKDT